MPSGGADRRRQVLFHVATVVQAGERICPRQEGELGGFASQPRCAVQAAEQRVGEHCRRDGDHGEQGRR